MATRRGWVLVFVALVCGCSGASRRTPAVDDNELRLPTPATIKLRNGVEVWHVRSTKIPMVELSLRFRCGSVQDPPAKHGLAALTFAMLDEGAGSRDALELADEIDFLAAELATGAERDFSGARLGTLKRNLDAALDIFADVVLRPHLEEEDWQRVRTLWLGELAQSREQPNLVARRVGDRAFYGDGQPYAHPVTGYSETVEAITLDDVKDFYATYVRPENAIFVCVGDIETATLKQELESRFGDWRGASPHPDDSKDSEDQAVRHDQSSCDAGSPKLIVVDKPDAPQTVIRVQIPGPSLFAKERAPLLLANIAFGGTFTSRLTLNLRERNKFTYGAQSVLAPRLGPSYLVAQSAVFSEQTVPALVEICREFRKMSTGELLPGELKKGLATHRIRLVRSLETQQGLLNLFADSAAAGQGIEERRRFHENVAAQTPAAVAKQVRKTFTWDQEANVIILVGDRKLIEAQLASHATEKDGEADCTFPAPEFRDVDGSLLP